LRWLFLFRRHFYEAAMTQTTHPSKQLVRDFMDARTRPAEPPPTPAEVSRQPSHAESFK
jgi:hypothetical protein